MPDDRDAPGSPTTPHAAADDALLSVASPSSSPTLSGPPPVPPKARSSPELAALQPAYIGSRLNPNAVRSSRPVSSADEPAMLGTLPALPHANRESMVLSRLANEEEQLLAGAPHQAAALRPLPSFSPNRFSRVSSTGSILSLADRDSKYPGANGPGTPLHTGAFIPYEYDPHEYDDVDAADDELDEKALRRTGGFSARGFFNVSALLLLLLGIIAALTAWPISSALVNDAVRQLIAGATQVNGTGQAAVLANIPKLVDPATPDEAKTRTGYDDLEYELVFSDEFNADNRSFAPGDDPFWEAVDLYYWATADEEWCVDRFDADARADTC